MGYDNLFLHSYSTEAGMSFSVVVASLPISSIALSISSLEIFNVSEFLQSLGWNL